MTIIRTKQEGNAIESIAFVGITYSERGFTAIGYSRSKTFKTELGARKWMRKMGYDC